MTFSIWRVENNLNFAQKYLNVPSLALSVPVVGTVDVVVLLVLDAAADWVLGLADQPVRDEQRREGVWGEVEPAQVLLSCAVICEGGYYLSADLFMFWYSTSVLPTLVPRSLKQPSSLSLCSRAGPLEVR